MAEEDETAGVPLFRTDAEMDVWSQQVEVRAARYVAEHATDRCRECRHPLAFDKPWARCVGCGWSEV